MAFEETSGSNMYMPVAPAYGGNGGWGMGGDGWWIILLLLACGGGWGGGFGGWGGMGFGNMALGYDFPWLLNGQNQINANTNAGFDHAATQAAIGDLSNAVTSGFGDVQTALCGGFAGVNATVNGAQNALAQQLYTNQISDLERSFAAQTASTQSTNAIQAQLAQCYCANRAATQDVKYTLATEACATRANSTANTQAILDKLCQLELDGYKREADQLRSQLQFANMQASQTAQTAQILAGQAAEIDGVYNRLKNCPVGTYNVCNPLTPAYQSGNCGCGGF